MREKLPGEAAKRGCGVCKTQLCCFVSLSSRSILKFTETQMANCVQCVCVFRLNLKDNSYKMRFLCLLLLQRMSDNGQYSSHNSSNLKFTFRS